VEPITIKSNASQATAVLIKDMGIVIPALGGSETLTEFRAILRAQRSGDLRALLIDDAHGADSSTLILNDGVSDVPQADASACLDVASFRNSGGPFSAMTADGAGDFDAMTHRVVNLSAPINPNDAARLIDAAVGPPWQEDEFTPTNGQITFILSQAPTDTVSLSFAVNGIRADDTDDYTVSGVTITWLNNLFAMETTDHVVVRYR
jgi:hypothetical protein